MNVLITLLILMPLQAKDISSAKIQLKDVNSNLKSQVDSLKSLEKKANNAVEKLREAENQYNLVHQAVNRLKDLTSANEKQIKALQHQIDSISVQLDSIQVALNKRLVFIYKYGDTFFIEALLGTKGVYDFLTKLDFIIRITRQDKKLLDEVSAGLKLVREKEEQLKVELENQKLLLAEKESEQAQLSELKVKRQSYFNAIAADKKEQKELVKSLKQQATAIQAVIDSLAKVAAEAEKPKPKPPEDKSTPEKKPEDLTIPKPVTKPDEDRKPLEGEDAALKGLDSQRNALPWPVNGKIIKKYGQHIHPVFKTVVVNNGIDIEANVGTSIKAIAKGRVVYAKWLKGVGKVVIIFHGRGFHTLYGHLSRINVVAGDMVNQGQVIGEAGSTDSAEGEILHFELHIKGKPQNPEDWLK